MARSKAKSRKTREPSDSNSTGDGQQNGNKNNLHNSRLVCRESTNPQRSLSRALNIRDQEKNRPMTSEEMKASKYKHFRPYEPSTTPQTLVTHERGRIRMEFPRRRNSSSSSFNPYDRWAENAAVDEVIELDTPPPPPSKSKPGRRGRKPGPKAGGATGSRMTPMSGTQGRLSYTLLGVAKENPLDRPRQMIYGVAFNNWVGETVDIFATVGDATVTVYRVRVLIICGILKIITTFYQFRREKTSKAALKHSHPTTPKEKSFTAATGRELSRRIQTFSSLRVTVVTFE